ncbi:hypothetical protein Vqi01_41270 [Micromonospora qiuiae]|uniref:HTH luxR-type domain-containing protein n=1 Tax=Micromonospora qiuiae TaxID=502268 RepID=A0ABQ4JHN4_9ACTN|nr:hypothetical protein Vqi01_41270 [Micromonospora qiuiae]
MANNEPTARPSTDRDTSLAAPHEIDAAGGLSDDDLRLRLLSEGHSNHEIAVLLCCSRTQLWSRQQQICRQLGVHAPIAAMVWRCTIS